MSVNNDDNASTTSCLDHTDQLDDAAAPRPLYRDRAASCGAAAAGHVPPAHCAEVVRREYGEPVRTRNLNAEVVEVRKP